MLDRRHCARGDVVVPVTGNKTEAGNGAIGSGEGLAWSEVIPESLVLRMARDGVERRTVPRIDQCNLCVAQGVGVADPCSTAC